MILIIKILMKEQIVIDTNIILEAINSGFLGIDTQVQSLYDEYLMRKKDCKYVFCITDTVIHELFKNLTATSRKGGLWEKPWKPKDAWELIEGKIISNGFVKLLPRTNIYYLRKCLMIHHSLTHNDFADITIASEMLNNNITKIWTRNEDDFKKLDDVQVIGTKALYKELFGEESELEEYTPSKDSNAPQISFDVVDHTDPDYMKFKIRNGGVGKALNVTVEILKGFDRNFIASSITRERISCLEGNKVKTPKNSRIKKTDEILRVIYNSEDKKSFSKCFKVNAAKTGFQKIETIY